MPAKDAIVDYYNFTHPNRWAAKTAFKHRLGKFQCLGTGSRRLGNGPIPSLGVLHVPVKDMRAKDLAAGKEDDTAEWVAAYLANPPEKRSASIHVCSDRDSFVICQPFDSEAWGAGNSFANAASVQFEIAGWGNEGDAYWSGDDAKLKLIQTAKALIKGSRLAFGDKWRDCIPPLRRAELNPNGSVKVPGWTQHREVPKYDVKAKVYRQKDKNNQVPGQHSDVAANFPYEHFFKIVEEEIRRETAAPVPLSPNRRKADQYTIQSGDILGKVARQYFGGDLNKLLSMNPHFTNPNLVRVGEIVLIPKQ